MHHPNARLTVHGRVLLCERVYVEGWTVSAAAKASGVSRQTASKWVCRFRSGLLELLDHASRPQRTRPRVAGTVVRAIVRARLRFRLGPHRLSWMLKVARSTIYAVLRRCGLNRLTWPQREVSIRYEWPACGDMLHLDVKKLGRIGEGGGKRFGPRTYRNKGVGWDYVHVAVDDHSRLAYAEILTDERGETAAAFTHRALDFFEGCGISTRRILTDNGSPYCSKVFASALDSRGVAMRKTKPRHPQTNGKAEAFIRLLSNEWAYAKAYNNNEERAEMLDPFLRSYNLSRPHGGLDGDTPISRVRCQ